MSGGLPDLQDEHVLEELTPFTPQFFIPRLAEKPQNPIMDSLNLSQDLKRPPVSSKLLAQALLNPVDQPSCLNPPIQLQSQGIWNVLHDLKAPNNTSLRSWDTFRSQSLSLSSSLSSYLSEQDSTVFAAARHYVRPLLIDSTVEAFYVNQEELLDSLRLVVTGTSSIFHSWDPQSESFTLRGMRPNTRAFLVIIGKDEIITESFLSRFVTIGTISRRLEIFISHITNSNAVPTIHAFAHALSSILTLVRVMLAESNNVPPASFLASYWVNCAGAEQVLTAVAKLCHREVTIHPSSYISLPSPMNLLSDVYAHCVYHFENSTPRIVTSVFAFILTLTSRDYFQQIRSTIRWGNLSLLLVDNHDLLGSDAVAYSRGVVPDSLEMEQQEHPCFVPKKLRRSLRNAQKSLRVLQAASPDHPLLTEYGQNLSSLGWIWTAQDVMNAWNRQAMDFQDDGLPQFSSHLALDGPTYKPELVDFQVFDRDPGAHLTGASPLARIQRFIANFPASLPPLTPTLNILTSLVLSPLEEHAAALSEALLEVFISRPISGSLTHKVDLNLCSHLILLRSFLLLCSHSFKSKLSTALFSDSDQYTWETQSREARSLALTQPPLMGLDELKPWPVGLALFARKSWPPGGVDLSFYLRTVIVDSAGVQANRKRTPSEFGMNCHSTAFDVAETSLGFAIRDLPTGKGRDRWLDPCSIEALDFLYMEYRPPGPLSTLISQEIMSKYQRIFAFNLRLMRVENVVRVLYRLSRSQNSPLFATFTRTNALFLHFRFLVQTFVTQFVSYVYDTAIRGNFDAFLEMLRPESLRKFQDIFSLAEHHSGVMDDVLTACLLRSGQKAAGDVLRGCLETILDLGVLAGELTRRRIQEYEAKSRLEELYEGFKRKMALLIQTLKMVAEKDIIDDSGSSSMKHGKIGGVYSIQHLLVKLDSGWW